jgi:hypothetical protein
MFAPAKEMLNRANENFKDLFAEKIVKVGTRIQEALYEVAAKGEYKTTIIFTGRSHRNPVSWIPSNYIHYNEEETMLNALAEFFDEQLTNDGYGTVIQTVKNNIIVLTIFFNPMKITKPGM